MESKISMAHGEGRWRKEKNYRDTVITLPLNQTAVQINQRDTWSVYRRVINDDTGRKRRGRGRRGEEEASTDAT